MTNFLWDLLFGCSHRKLSLPITVRKNRPVGQPPGERETYCVCLECGKKFPYSWEKMKILHAVKEQRPQAAGIYGWFSRHRWHSRGT